LLKRNVPSNHTRASSKNDVDARELSEKKNSFVKRYRRLPGVGMLSRKSGSNEVSAYYLVCLLRTRVDAFLSSSCKRYWVCIAAIAQPFDETRRLLFDARC
jgi:hypothetical protein